jgi:septin family protein
MVIKKVNLDIVIGVTSAIPDTQYPEVAFAGKSNVGKSSLINSLMNRKSYARHRQLIFIILMTACILWIFPDMDMRMQVRLLRLNGER